MTQMEERWDLTLFYLVAIDVSRKHCKYCELFIALQLNSRDHVESKEMSSGWWEDDCSKFQWWTCFRVQRDSLPPPAGSLRIPWHCSPETHWPFPERVKQGNIPEGWKAGKITQLLRGDTGPCYQCIMQFSFSQLKQANNPKLYVKMALKHSHIPSLHFYCSASLSSWHPFIIILEKEWGKKTTRLQLCFLFWCRVCMHAHVHTCIGGGWVTSGGT